MHRLSGGFTSERVFQLLGMVDYLLDLLADAEVSSEAKRRANYRVETARQPARLGSRAASAHLSPQSRKSDHENISIPSQSR